MLVDGVVASGQVGLRAASAATPGEAQDLSKHRRAQRLLANPRLDVNRAQRRLVTHVLRRCQGGWICCCTRRRPGRRRPTATDGGTVTLCFALAWQGCAMPLVWRTWAADRPGQDWATALREMALVVQAALATDTQVVVLADRGLSGGPFARLWQEVGWQWQQSRVRRPARVARLVLVLVLATWWMLALAQRVVRRGRRPWVEACSRRECSVFQVGLRYLRHCLANDHLIPVTWRLFPVTHAPLKLS